MPVFGSFSYKSSWGHSPFAPPPLLTLSAAGNRVAITATAADMAEPALAPELAVSIKLIELEADFCPRWPWLPPTSIFWQLWLDRLVMCDPVTGMPGTSSHS